MTAGRLTRFARQQWIAAALIGTTVSMTMHPDARSEEPLRAHGVAALNRLGRSLGIGYSDGYHSAQWRPARVHGDRPPESYWARRPDTAPVAISHASQFHPYAAAPEVSPPLDAAPISPYHDRSVVAPPLNPASPLPAAPAAPSAEQPSAREIEPPAAQLREPPVAPPPVSVPPAELPTPQNPPEQLPADPPASEPPTPTPTSAPSAAASPSDRPAEEAVEVGEPVERMPEEPAAEGGELLWPPRERADEEDPLDEFGDEPLAEITRLPPPPPKFSAPVRLGPMRPNPVPVRLPPVTR